MKRTRPTTPRKQSTPGGLRITITRKDGRLIIHVPARIASVINAHNLALHPVYETAPQSEAPRTPHRGTLAIIPASGSIEAHVQTLNRLFDPREKCVEGAVCD